MKNSFVIAVFFFSWNYAGVSTLQKLGYELCVEGMTHPLESGNTTQWKDFTPVLNQQFLKSKDISHDSIFAHHTAHLQSSPVTFKFSEKQRLKNTQTIQEHSPISKLYELCNKYSLPLNFHIDSEGPAHKKVFRITCTAGEHAAFGQGSTKSVAKQNAANGMLELLRSLHSTETSQTKKSNKKQKPIKHSSDTDPIPYLHEWSRHRVQYIEGDHADNIFFINCLLDDMQVTGEGRSKKIAKRMAAAEMIKMLREQGKLQETEKPSESHISGTVQPPQTASSDYSEAAVNNLEKMETFKPSQSDLDHSEKSKNDNSDENPGDVKDLLRAVVEEMGYQFSYRNVVNGKAHLSFVSVSSGNSFTCYGFGSDKEQSQQEAARTAIQHLIKILHIDWSEIPLKDTGSHFISQDSNGHFYLETRK